MGAFRFCFTRSLIKWYAEAGKHLLQKVSFAVINQPTSTFAAFPRATRSIKYEDQLYVVGA
jgi:hypothetical protein